MDQALYFDLRQPMSEVTQMADGQPIEMGQYRKRSKLASTAVHAF